MKYCTIYCRLNHSRSFFSLLNLSPRRFAFRHATTLKISIFSLLNYLRDRCLNFSAFLIPYYYISSNIFLFFQLSFERIWNYMYSFCMLNFDCYFYELAYIIQTDQLSIWLRPHIFCCYQLTYVWPIHKPQIIINKTLWRRSHS